MSKISIFDFDDRNRAFVSEEQFREYLQATAEDDDYERERDGVVYFYNGGGCLLAEYHRQEGYGQTF
jgi:hypothetical protein